MKVSEKAVIAATIKWLERIVIGLNFCPFAKPIYTKKQIRFVVSCACKSDALLNELKEELSLIVATASEKIESTLLIHPDVLNNFVDYNSFLAVCDLAVEELGLDGILQIASFHPQYRFADTPDDDVTNCTNRSPYPMLHLLRESSVTRAIESYPDANKIYERNIELLNRLGKEKVDAIWTDLMQGET